MTLVQEFAIYCEQNGMPSDDVGSAAFYANWFKIHTHPARPHYRRVERPAGLRGARHPTHGLPDRTPRPRVGPSAARVGFRSRLAPELTASGRYADAEVRLWNSRSVSAPGATSSSSRRVSTHNRN